MPFQQDADSFTDRALVSAGDAGQIVIDRFGDMELHIAVALGAAGFFGCGFRRKPQGGISSGTFGHGGGFHTTPQVEGGVASTTAYRRLGLFARAAKPGLIFPYQPRQ